MIELINVSKYYPTEFGRHYVFRNVSLTLPMSKSVGVLGPNGAGKSTFLRLLGGSDMPSEGRIIKTGRISPPMGLTPGIQAALTASENARFAGRIYGMTRDDINDMIEYVRNLADIGKYFDMPVSTYSAGMKQRVSFAINMSLTFDYYLFDEISAGGDKEFRKISKRMVQDRLQTSKFIVASHRMDELIELCDAGIVIQGGELKYFENIREAIAFYGDLEELPESRSERRQRRAKAADSGTPLGSDEKTTVRKSRRQRRADRKATSLAVAATAGQTGNDKIGHAFEDYALREQSIADAERKSVAETERLKRKDERRAIVEARRLERLAANQQALAETAISVPEPAPPQFGDAKFHPDEAVTAEEIPEALAETELVSLRQKKRRARRSRIKARLGDELATPEQLNVDDGEAVVEEATPEDLRNLELRTDRKRQRQVERRKARKAARQVSPDDDGSNIVGEPEASAEGSAMEPEIDASPAGPHRVTMKGRRRKANRMPDAEPHSPGAQSAGETEQATSAVELPGAQVSTTATPASALPLQAFVSQLGGNLLLRRAVLRQELARLKSARALRLLLNHLDRVPEDAMSAVPVSASEVSDAQKSAAAEAILAREIVESTLGIKSDPQHSSNIASTVRLARSWLPLAPRINRRVARGPFTQTDRQE